MGFEWRCHFCDLPQIATSENMQDTLVSLGVGKTKHGNLCLASLSARCLNELCNELTLIVMLKKASWNVHNQLIAGDETISWKLLPESSFRKQPEYIPEPIRRDYYEACLIRDKSSKASATLARRCIQGMIRDFCGISKPTLDVELKELRKQFDDGTAPRWISDESIVAIDKVRKIGNIGAHMERDINVIVEVDPDEAQILIDLIEMLFSEWYVAREKRRLRLEELSALADAKQAAKLVAPSVTPALPKP